MNRVPVSAPNAQQYVVWGFPGLIAYAGYLLFDAQTAGKIALLICSLIVLTGWSSYALLGQSKYNDVLFFSDVGLIIGYLILIRAASQLDFEPFAEGALSIGTAAVFFLYALWNVGAVFNTDTHARASKFHLQTFSWVSVGVGPLSGIWGFLLLGILGSERSFAEITRVFLLIVWVAVLLFWHAGRIRAAMKD